MDKTLAINTLVLDAMHLAEVGWMLQVAGLDAETVAAGFCRAARIQ